MKYTILSTAILLLQTIDAFQLPFNLGQLPKVFQSDLSLNQPHYSTLKHDDIPINLSQYEDDIVVRLSYEKHLKEYLLLQKDIKFNKWAQNNNARTMDIQIKKSDFYNNLLTKFPNLKYEIIIEDLSQTAYETFPKSNDFTISNDLDFHAQSELFFEEYRNLNTIESWLNLLQITYPQVINIEEIGDTYEHKKLKVVHFQVPNDIDHKSKKTIVITGGVHAREWISVSTTLYLIYQLIRLYNTWPGSKILTQLNFLFIPVFNPDGYEYTWTTDRLWRKNRQETPIPKCFGIDIDHSYDYHWTKSTDWACGEEYSGDIPFEAFESKIWDNYLNETNQEHKIYGYLDLHSYSQEILYPYAYSCNQQPRDEENLIELAWGIAKSIRLKSGSNYQVLPACIDKDSDLLPDLGSGSSLDYMYHNKAYWAYQLKLRDTGSHGFLLPSKYIEPVGDEIVSAIKYFCEFILSDDR
ncbi:ECM14 [Candida pseudojiufengensis]|uniref:ECM14 n=1 Tax=Candida pseudojiufengensis TaxID=497109 RepID=UPI0022240860|nr:ECM14 [Candida pseudojiufengensis]KAI5959581.1 ECM14 [Candida pseudojiufengensis]